MKKYLPYLVGMIATGIVSSIITYKIYAPRPELASPTPESSNCVELNIRVNPEYVSPTPTAIPQKSDNGQPLSYSESSPTYNVEASYYTTDYCRQYNPDCLTASGEVFKDEGYTAACSYDFKMGTKIRLTSENGSVTVRCNDRGSFEEKYSRKFDLTKTAFSELAPLSKGVVKVAYQVVK